jgi:hypothetical protein
MSRKRPKEEPIHLAPIAREILKEEWEKRQPGYPYYWEYTHSLFVYGPSLDIDYYEGYRTHTREQITCISLYEDHGTVHVYEKYIPAIKGKFIWESGNTKKIDYGDPRFPGLLINTALEIVDHHALLIECTRDEYVDFVLDQKRQGKIMPDMEDLPPQHRDSWESDYPTRLPSRVRV